MYTLKYTLLVDKVNTGTPATSISEAVPLEREEHSVVAGPWIRPEIPEQLMYELVTKFPAAIVGVEITGQADALAGEAV